MVTALGALYVHYEPPEPYASATDNYYRREDLRERCKDAVHTAASSEIPRTCLHPAPAPAPHLHHVTSSHMITMTAHGRMNLGQGSLRISDMLSSGNWTSEICVSCIRL